MSTVVNTDLYVGETKSPGVEHKIVRARLFAAVESTKGMTYPVGTRLPSLPPTRIYARLTAQGTAASETAACLAHLRDSMPTDDTVTEPVDCSENEALSCQTCGATSLPLGVSR